MYSTSKSKAFVFQIGVLALILSPIICLATPGYLHNSLSGSPQMNIRPAGDSVNPQTQAPAPADTVTDLVVVLFSGPSDTVRDTLTTGMIPALEVAAMPPDSLEKFTSISVHKTTSVPAQKIFAKNEYPVRQPVW